MDFISAHKIFNEHVKLSNTSVVRPETFQDYYNNSQIEFVRGNYVIGGDAKQMNIDNIQHLRIITDGFMKWKGTALDPIASQDDKSVPLFIEWNQNYKNSSNVDIAAPKYLRRASVSCKIEYGNDDPCKRGGQLSEYMDARYLKANQRNLIKKSTIRGISNEKPYYFIADNKILFELYGSSKLHSVIIEYYRYPVNIAWNKGSGVQDTDGGTYPAYGITQDTIHPELQDEDVRIVCRMAAQRYIESVQSKRIQTFK